MKKLFFIVILTIFAVGIAVYAQTPRVTRIIFYQRGYVAGGTDAGSVTTAKAIELFEKANPNIKIEIVGIPWTAEGDTKLETALAARSDINIFRVTSVNMPRYAKQGILSEVEPYLTAEDKADFYESAWDIASYKGKKYAWPLWVTAITILANTDIFKERGVALPSFDKPWTYDEFVAAAQKLTFTRADGTKIYGVTASSKAGAVEYWPMLYIDGGRILSPDGKKFVANKPEFVSALQKYADLNLKYKVGPLDFGVPDQVTVQSQFQKNKTVAMLISTPGFIRTLVNDKFPLAVLPIPTGKLGKPVTNGAFGLYAVVDGPDKDKVAAAHKLARYLTGSQIGVDIPGFQLAPGLRKSNRNLDADPYFSLVARAVQYGVYEVPTEVPNEIQNTQFVAALQAVILGQKKAQDAMNEIAVPYQKSLDEVNK
ncbi:MAG: extracellular solute-binding protein [Spirochaetota bacterium]